ACGRELPTTYVGSGGRCYDCYLAGLLPGWYQRAERYSPVPGGALTNATARPKTGIELLDGTPPRLSEVGFRAVMLPSHRNTGLSLADFLREGLTGCLRVRYPKSLETNNREAT
ncbi:MAG TPA: hypothetical protein VMW52_09225, partial [Phycisphaerae bacterium]|nr:hypothetical protein [Phycisphaerae bacterium]